MIGSVLLTSLACDQSAKKNEVSQEQYQEIIQTHGEKFAMQLLKPLKENLMKHLKESTPAEALKYCSSNAQGLTEKVNQSLPKGVTVTRTSAKVRNPKNTPTAEDKKALEFFENQIKNKKELAKFFTQNISQNKKTKYVYYKPLKLNAMCLTCHGDIYNSGNTDMVKILKEKYPNDKAFGYKDGDFRGVVKVTFTEKSIHNLAKK